ncbi:MAG: HD domain-containing protein [Nanoarchaeota archaeon]
MELKTYQPLNYNMWDFSGQGKNIAALLQPIEKELWNRALSLQDKRLDPGHAEFVTYFALELLKYELGDRKVVVPAAILHDIGWSQMSPAEVNLFSDPNMKRYEPALRARHQEEGARKARDILIDSGYSQPHIPHIVEIISQHDTRDGFYSLEDGIMRDADKLWRFTIPEVEISTTHRSKTLEGLDVRNRKYIQKENFLYSDTAKEIARIEWENTLKTLREKLKQR